MVEYIEKLHTELDIEGFRDFWDVSVFEDREINGG